MYRWRSETHKCSDLIDQDIITKYLQYITNNFDLSLDEYKTFLPNIYWLNNIHQNSTKFRFITASPVSSLRHLLN